MERLRWRTPLFAFRRKRKRPVLTLLDRLFWVGLSHAWNGWRGPLLYVQADTVVRWQGERFRRFWARLSKPRCRRRGRPATAVEIRRLIERMVVANPGRVEDWRHCSVGSAYPFLPVSFGSASLASALDAGPYLKRNLASGVLLWMLRRATGTGSRPFLQWCC
jgi:hypothetical protein